MESLVARAVMDQFRQEQKFLQPHQAISFPQLIFLLEMSTEEESFTFQALCRILNHSTAALNGMMERMEKSGFVQRMHIPEDRRTQRVGLTAKGKNLLSEFASGIVQS